MAAVAQSVEAMFCVLVLVPELPHAQVAEASILRNYTTWFNIPFLALAALLVWRFPRAGGRDVLRMRPAEGRSRGFGAQSCEPHLTGPNL